MVTVIPEHLKDLWDAWNLRVAILFSLSLQIFLIFSATSRKKRRPGKLSIMIWLAYLLADWIAAFAVGLISNGMSNDCPDDFSVNKSLTALWAPFLLLHLGGPDSITAFSLEDNELWIRHLFGLLIQLVAVSYVFLQSLPNDFWIPTGLILIAGTIKYFERTRSLYVACLGNFKDSLLPKPDAGPNYAQLMEEYSSKEAAQVPVKIVTINETDRVSKGPTVTKVETPDVEKLTNSEIVQKAFELYRKFRGLIVDHMLSFQERDESRAFFLQQSAENAFGVMEAELNFMYDELYTKMAVVHHSIWHLSRIICFVLVVVSLQHFASHHKHSIHKIDVRITYTLLIGALALEIMAHVKLIFSDWTIAMIKEPRAVRIVSSLREQLSFIRRRRWSNTISQHSLMYCCLNRRSKWTKKIIQLFGLESVLDEWKYKRHEPLEEKLRDFIFVELRGKAENATTIKAAKAITSARGELALLVYPRYNKYKLIAASVGEEVEFDESILLWHIATEICYFKSMKDENIPKRNMCKHVSDYMLYLLIMRPTLMSAVAGIAQIRFQDTCAEAKRFLGRYLISRSKNKSLLSFDCLTQCFKGKFMNCCGSSYSEFKDELIDASSQLLNVKTDTKPSDVKGDRSKSLLFDACRLAKELQELDDSNRWEMMSKVWVDLLCYAASHCRASSHAEQVSKGGELITFVWLLMAHFGLGDQFRIQAGHARAKLIVGK